jgi:hypothetical protein
MMALFQLIPAEVVPHSQRYMRRGGQSLSPYEQNTQQSPGLGLTTARQCGQSQKNTQASVGMISTDPAPHTGQRIIVVSGWSMAQQSKRPPASGSGPAACKTSSAVHINPAAIAGVVE